jgi:ATP-binding cassette subfamily F protein 3
VRASTERLRNEAKAAEAAAVKRAHVQAFIDKFRYNAKRASLVQSRIKALERMAETAPVERDPECVFSFPALGAGAAASLSPPIIGFNDVDFGYSPVGSVLFKCVIACV